MINIINTTISLYVQILKRVSPEFSSQGKKIFFPSDEHSQDFLCQHFSQTPAWPAGSLPSGHHCRDTSAGLLAVRPLPGL